MTSARGTGPLTGWAVLVTRPAHQAFGLARRLEALGGEAVLQPTIEIRDPPDPGPLRRAATAARTFDVLVFVSANAAARAVPALLSGGGPAPGAAVVAVGEGTAAELKKQGLERIITPSGGADSEALLRLEALTAVSGKHVAIFAGVGGRTLLADTLAARGAHVTTVACYQRAKPDGTTDGLEVRLREGRLQAVTVTSREGLHNLFDMIRPSCVDALRRVAFVVPHARIADAARALGVERVLVCDSGDDALVAALLDLAGRGAAAAVAGHSS
jgi:uroporphyrinogen-III synthase